MTSAANSSVGLYLTRERTDLGQEFLRVAVISLMFLSILAPVVRLTSTLWIKIEQLFLPVVVVVYLCLLLAGLARPIRRNGLFVVAVVFMLSIAVSMLYGTQVIGHALLSRDFFELAKPLFPLLFFTLAYEADFSEQSLRTLARTLFPAILLICLYAYGQWFNMSFTSYLQPYYSGGLHDDGGLAHYRRVYSTLSNPNYLAMLMTWVIAVFTMGALFRVGSRFSNIALLLASLTTLAMTGSRYGLIDTVLALFLIFVLPTRAEGSKRRRRVALLLTLPVVLGAVLLVSMSNRATLERFEQLQNPLQENSLRARLDGVWRDAGREFLDSPLLGHGPAKIIFSNVYTDSEYLQILKQYGVVGLVPYLSYFLLPLGMVWRGLWSAAKAGPRLENERPATYWAVCVSFVMIVTALFMNIGMSTYYNFSLLAFLWMWMGIGASSARRIAGASQMRVKLWPAKASL